MLTPLIAYTKRFLNKVIGAPARFSLESRIFHTFSFFVAIVLVFETVFNIAIHLYVSAALGFMVLLIQGYLFYLARFENKLQLAVVLSAFEVNIIKGVGYFYNDGIIGGSLLLFAASLFILMSVSKKKFWPVLLVMNLLVVFFIVGYEYLYPYSVKQHYATRTEQFADNIVTYLVTVVLLYVGTASIRKSYTRQKNLTDEKTLALELLNAEKVKLFSIIAHDLRTPLASVQQYFKVLTEVGADAEERAEMEKDLLKTIGHTQELLSNLLKWASNQMQGATAHLKTVEVSHYLQDTTELFETIANKKDIVLTTVADDINVRADPDMLQIVIRNLLTNAVKFTNPGGEIKLTAASEGDSCIISVSDNGVGIPLNRQGGIFSLNASSTNGTQNENGTGLGLVLCKDYTELQGGRIWFTSTEGAGTTFYISLPLVQLKLFTA